MRKRKKAYGRKSWLKTGIVRCEEKRLECRTWHNAERERER